jgi:nucleotide-binding universal stress UspA family protein
MKILFATDGSAAALAALASLTARRAWFRGDVELTLLHVHLQIPFRRAAAWAGHDVLQKYYDEESDAALAPAIAALEADGVAFRAEKRVGEPAPTIVAVAGEGGYDLVALGAQGHSALEHFMLGSVATKVVATSSVPVLLLR